MILAEAKILAFWHLNFLFTSELNPIVNGCVKDSVSGGEKGCVKDSVIGGMYGCINSTTSGYVKGGTDSCVKGCKNGRECGTGKGEVRIGDETKIRTPAVVRLITPAL